MLSKSLSLAPSSYCEAQFKNHQTTTSKILREKKKNPKSSKDFWWIYYLLLIFLPLLYNERTKNKLLQFTYKKRTSKENLVAMSYSCKAENFLFSHRRTPVFRTAALQMFCLLNPQMNACEPNPNSTCSDFNRLKSVIKNFYLHAIFKMWYVPL